MFRFSRLSLFAVLCFPVVNERIAFAVPYASGLHNIGLDTYEFILNESADNVTILRDGGNALELGALASGRHSFSTAGFNQVEIKVSKNAPTAWTAITDSSNPFTNYEQPTGIAVNTIPSSPYFGTVYVNNSRTNITASGRDMGSGVYALTANIRGVDLANNLQEITDANDVSQAKAPGWTPNTNTASPFRMSLDDAGNLIIGDWSDSFGGVKYATANLTSGGLLLNIEGGPSGGVLSTTVMDEFGFLPIHGSIGSTPIVSGKLGVDLTLWAIDEDLDVDLSVPGNDGNSVWRWDVGTTVGNYDINPTLVIRGRDVEKTTESAGVIARDNWLPLNVGIGADAVYDTVRNKWYLTQGRSNGNEAGLIVLTPGANGTSTLEWSSLQFSIDNNLDGFANSPAIPAGNSSDIQDIFRSVGGGMVLSEDGSKLFITRTAHTSTNPILGTTSPDPGAILIIPLDEDGIPDLQVDIGTILNLDTITTASNAANSTRRPLAIDAAGNVYSANNISERLQVFSPGGNTLAITGFNITTSVGTFSVSPIVPPTGLVGDYNDDGFVNAADYAVWRDNLGSPSLPDGRDPNNTGPVDDDDYDSWYANFGATPGSGSSTAVPEPTSLVLLSLLATSFLFYRNRR